MEEIAVSTVAHVIQLAVAPVFMLAGIGSILSVMNHRLSRVMDRVRVLEIKQEQGADRQLIDLELATLAKRARLAIKAITLGSITALLICGVIATLFLGAIFDFNTGAIVSFFFITAMLSFIIGLLIFLREIFLAMDYLTAGKRFRQ